MGRQTSRPQSKYETGVPPVGTYNPQLPQKHSFLVNEDGKFVL